MSALVAGLGAAVVVIALVAIIGLVLALASAARRGRRPSDRMILSPDGNYWWDGTRWQPVPRS